MPRRTSANNFFVPNSLSRRDITLPNWRACRKNPVGVIKRILPYQILWKEETLPYPTNNKVVAGIVLSDWCRQFLYDDLCKRNSSYWCHLCDDWFQEGFITFLLFATRIWEWCVRWCDILRLERGFTVMLRVSGRKATENMFCDCQEAFLWLTSDCRRYWEGRRVCDKGL